MIDDMVPITEAKAKLPEIVRAAGDNTMTVLLRHGRPAALVIGVEQYDALLEEIEDLKDRLSVYESRENGPAARVSLDTLLAELEEVDAKERTPPSGMSHPSSAGAGPPGTRSHGPDLAGVLRYLTAMEATPGGPD